MHERLVASSGQGVCVRRLGKDRAGEIRLTRFLRNDAVSVEEMIETASARTRALAKDRHILAIQDTTMVRGEDKGRGVALHPMIAVDAVDHAMLGLIAAQFFIRGGGKKALRRSKDFAEKESHRWLDGSISAAQLMAAGAACVTMIADREGDIYEDFACKPDEIEVLVRAGQDRRLVNGSRLFDVADGLPEAGRMFVELPAAPGRSARTARLALRFCRVELPRPLSRQRTEAYHATPKSVVVTLVDAREIDPPAGTQAHWRLLTTHAVSDIAEACRIVEFYRQRWAIEQVFRTIKTHGFNVEALRLAENGPFEKLVAATLIAAVTVTQLVHDRDGVAKRPLADAIDPADRPVLEAVSATLQGNTQRQMNPHPNGSLAFAAWVFARLGGWNCYYGKPGPVVILHGLIQFHAIKHGWRLRNV